MRITFCTGTIVRIAEFADYFSALSRWLERCPFERNQLRRLSRVPRREENRSRRKPALRNLYETWSTHPQELLYAKQKEKIISGI
ncbi:hypothetical protein AVEN_213600-1 [Araneus ventricosus]|uniref:Uncharacterized protein n=1 Tax=Araneus ventricosus TaxID=182803 RepID=A0A4Y1ZLG4_ARAVE|nr:hypothetical protein AVEN_213600-1 [Araneus ventricosus]